MAVRLVYRLYGGENRKGRPEIYDKATCLASFLLAAGIAGAEVTVLADGPLPVAWRALAARHGRVVDIAGGPVGMRGSYRAALELPDRLGWDDDDVVYFSEDDYLHRPEAFRELARAAAAVPSASYFALYASTPRHPAAGPGLPYTAPANWTAAPDISVAGQRWVNVPSTTSSFGARLGMLRRDLGIFRQGMVPYPKRLLDHETCLVCQGTFPYRRAEIVLGPESTRFRTGWRSAAANAVLTPFRLAFNVRALSRRRHPHLLYAADPNLACHLETNFMAPGVDWTDVAAAARHFEGWPPSPISRAG